MSVAKAFLQRLDEVNPLKLGRAPVRKLTISTTANKLEALRNSLDVMLSEFVLEEDDPKTVAGIRDAMKLINSAVASLRKVENIHE